MRKSKFSWPLPVYVARFKGGEECRLSFGTLAGKPLDFDRGRRYACHVIGNERGRAGRGRLSESTPYWEAYNQYYEPADDIEYGEVEWDGEVFIDPFFLPKPAAPVKAAKPSTLDRLLAQIAKLTPAERAILEAAL